jgi:hypothetical protein
MSTSLGVWIAAFLTLGIMSFLYKDNPVYKFCEAVFVGVSAGYWFVVEFFNVVLPKVWDNLAIAVNVLQEQGRVDWFHWSYLLGGILGVLMLLRLVPKIGWISRWPLAVVVGTTAGLWLINYFVSNAMVQVRHTIIPLYVAGDLNTTIGSIIIVVGTFCGLIYFFFSKEHKGAFGGAAKVGIWFIMITFGASFGYTVMSRMSLLIARMDFLVGTWLGLIK